MIPHMLPATLFLINIASTCFMTGVIWFVQVVHYPGFGAIGTDTFGEYHNRHTSRTTYVVAGPMLLELISSVGLVFYGGRLLPLDWAIVGLILVLVIWLSTALLQVPQHNYLAGGFIAGRHRLLVSTNWIRTISWSVRSAMMLWAVARMIGAT